MNSIIDEECNHGWDEDVFYSLGLDRVWHDNSGNWIPDEYRYDGNENNILGWYSYCQVHNIHWPYPVGLPNWAIEDMDQYYRDSYYLTATELN